MRPTRATACTLAVAWSLAIAMPASADAELPSPGKAASQEAAAPFIAFADQILAAVTTGQSGAFRATISPTTVAGWEEGDVDIFVDQVVMPFFADYDHSADQEWIAPTTSPAGFTGFAFYRSFVAKNGRAKPYVLYLLDENGRMVVGNLLVGKTFQDMHGQQ